MDIPLQVLGFALRLPSLMKHTAMCHLPVYANMHHKRWEWIQVMNRVQLYDREGEMHGRRRFVSTQMFLFFSFFCCCFYVFKITQKRLTGFPRNFQDMLAVGHGPTD